MNVNNMNNNVNKYFNNRITEMSSSSNASSGNYRFIYQVSGSGNTFGDYDYLKTFSFSEPQALFIDLDSIRMSDSNNSILFACLTMPNNETKYYSYGLKDFDIDTAEFHEMLISKGAGSLHKWAKDKNGLYYDTYRNNIITPPGNLMKNGFIRILEGK